MATLVLGIAGSALGGALLPSGLTLFGSTLTGSAIGGAAASIGGAFVDQALLGPLAGATGLNSLQAGPRLSDVKLGTSSEGTPIPRVYGRVRIPGQLIWATRFKEEKRKVKQANAGGGKNTGITADQSGAVEYRYYANVAYALCEGPILGISQIWADGKKLKQKKLHFDVHLGTEDQEPNAFMVSKEGAGTVPAYRGVAYVVFKEWPLEAFGNRLPVVNFEVIRAFDPFEEQVRAVTVIPGAGEFIYDPEPVIATTGGVTVPENVHQEDAATDALASAVYLHGLAGDVAAGRCRSPPRTGLSRSCRSQPLSAALEVDEALGLQVADGRHARGHELDVRCLADLVGVDLEPLEGDRAQVVLDAVLGEPGEPLGNVLRQLGLGPRRPGEILEEVLHARPVVDGHELDLERIEAVDLEVVVHVAQHGVEALRVAEIAVVDHRDRRFLLEILEFELGRGGAGRAGRGGEDATRGERSEGVATIDVGHGAPFPFGPGSRARHWPRLCAGCGAAVNGDGAVQAALGSERHRHTPGLGRTRAGKDDIDDGRVVGLVPFVAEQGRRRAECRDEARDVGVPPAHHADLAEPGGNIAQPLDEVGDLLVVEIVGNCEAAERPRQGLDGLDRAARALRRLGRDEEVRPAERLGNPGGEALGAPRAGLRKVRIRLLAGLLGMAEDDEARRARAVREG